MEHGNPALRTSVWLLSFPREGLPGSLPTHRQGNVRHTRRVERSCERSSAAAVECGCVHSHHRPCGTQAPVVAATTHQCT